MIFAIALGAGCCSFHCKRLSLYTYTFLAIDAATGNELKSEDIRIRTDPLGKNPHELPRYVQLHPGRPLYRDTWVGFADSEMIIGCEGYHSVTVTPTVVNGGRHSTIGIMNVTTVRLDRITEQKN
jgi:hypothetical protein